MRGAPTTARPRFIEKQRALADAYHKCNLANYAQALGKARDLGLHLAEVKAVKEQRRRTTENISGHESLQFTHTHTHTTHARTHTQTHTHTHTHTHTGGCGAASPLS